MKKRILRFAVYLALPAMFVSCDTDFLNTEPQDRVSSDLVREDRALSEAFVLGNYSALGYGGFEEQGLASYTDEAMFTHAGRNLNTFTEGTETESNLAWMSETYEWTSMYQAIRGTNIALTDLPEVTWDDPELQERLMGESHFQRAYYYHQLMRFYGGVPLIDQVYALDADFAIARNTFGETVDFIIADLDAAASMLDGKEETAGRASRAAALALKSRVLMYAASDLHSADSPIGTELHRYTTGGQPSWEMVRDAARAALDETEGYMFGLTAPVSAEEGTANYNAIAMGGGSAVADASAAVELIFQRSATADFVQESQWPLGGLHYGINNGPNGYNNWAGNTPIQQLVDDYEMMDGTSFDWNNPAHAATPFENRDPRFYATILYDGADWKPRPPAAAPRDPANQVQTVSTYENSDGGTNPGLDTRDSDIENWNGSRTHYYTRKFIDPNPALPDNQSFAQVVPWPFLRYTEVALNYVESLLETGDEGTAREWLNQIRFRAGMPATMATGDDLMELYRNERRIELQYEEHRYHDARRWMIPEETVGRPIEIINITATVRPGQTAHVPYRYDPEVYDYTYTVVPNTDNEVRTWNNSMYYRALDRDELNRNELLVGNNPGG